MSDRQINDLSSPPSMLFPFLSEDTMQESPACGLVAQPILRRFRDYDKSIRFNRILGRGQEGAALAITVDGKMYALKLVRQSHLTAASCRLT